MNGVLPSLGGVALFLAAGLGLVELVPSVRTLPWPRRLAWAYLLGLAGLAGALYALSHFAGLPLRREGILAVAAGLVLCGVVARGLRRLGWRRTRTFTDRHGRLAEASVRVRARQWPSMHRLATAFLALICLGLLADALTDPVTGWDGRMTWSTQALWVLDEGTVDSEVLRRENLYVTHPQYPLLMPVAQVVVLATFAVPPDVHAYRALYTTCFAAFLLLLWDGGRRWAGRLPTLLAGLAAAGAPALTFFEDSGAASGYSDLPLACFYGAGLLLLLRGRRNLGDALGAGLLLAGAALTKNEGAVLAFLALGIAALFRLGKKFSPPRPKLHALLRLAVAAIPLLLALWLLASWRAGIPNRQDERYDVLIGTEELWQGALPRLPGLALLALRQMFRFDHWTLFWIVVPVVFWVGRRGWSGRRRRLALALAAGVLAPLAIAFAAYAIHPHPDTLVPVTWTRFLVQGALPLFLLLALALREVLRGQTLLAAPLARVSQGNSAL